MPNFQLKNLDHITKNVDVRLGETLQQLQAAINAISQQTASVPEGQQNVPAAPSSLTVTAAGGIFHIVIQDNNPSQVGLAVDYFVEYSTTSGFQNPHPIHLGPSRDTRQNLGNQTLYWRCYAQYSRASQVSAYTYYGSPSAVVGGGAVSGPSIPQPAGSGTSPSSGFNAGYGWGKLSTR